MYLCGPTVYNYVHIGNARGPVVFGLLARLLRRRYRRAASTRATSPTSTTRSTPRRKEPARRSPRSPIATPPRTTKTWPRSASTRRTVEPARDRAHPADHRDDRAPDRQRPRLRGRRPRAVRRSPAIADYGNLSRRDRRRHDRRRARRSRAVQARSRRLRAVEAVDAATCPAGIALGPRPSGLAHRMLGDGARRTWARRSTSMPAASTCMFPHHENEIAQSDCAHGGSIFARWWLHNGMLNFGGAKMSKSLGNIEKVHDLVRAASAGSAALRAAVGALPAAAGMVGRR